MVDVETNGDLKFLKPLLADLFVIDAVYRQGKDVVASMSYRYNRAATDKALHDRLRLAGYRYSLRPTDTHLVLTIDPRRRLYVPPVNIILFLITLGTVYILPVFMRYGQLELPFSVNARRTLDALSQGAGIEFTLALVSILFVHEMGHFVASRRRGIITSWPYFIPAPNLIGTFGALIRSRSPFWNRRDLIEVGAAGPIAGWIVALGWIVYGLSRSSILAGNAVLPEQFGFQLDGESILMHLLVPAIVGTASPGNVYVLSEAAFAGWVGLLVTAFNLIPVGQFDGGHIMYGLFPRRQSVLGWSAMGILLVLGFQFPGWWLFAALGMFFGVAHPPTMEDTRPIGTGAQLMGYFSIFILLVSVTPKPFG